MSDNLKLLAKIEKIYVDIIDLHASEEWQCLHAVSPEIELSLLETLAQSMTLYKATYEALRSNYAVSQKPTL